MTDIVEFLKARLAEDEQTAKSAFRSMDADPPPREPDDGVWTTDDNLHPVFGIGIALFDEGTVDEGRAVHIARHDPARALREVEAKRAIIEQATSAHMAYYEDENGDMIESVLWDCVKSLAGVYSDHPDYRQEWSA